MKITIMGCGWLGLPVAKHLQEGGHQVVATRRSKLGVDDLKTHKITAIEFELGEALNQTKLEPIFACDLLFLNIPVGRKSAASADFTSNIESVVKHAKHSNIRHILFISTSSVYGDESRIVTAKSQPNPVTQSATINLQIEQLVNRYFDSNATVLRLSGLVGNNRHPAKFLAGKKHLANANQVVNLIHQDDVVLAIDKIVNNNIWGQSLVLSSAEHPTRKDYYTWAAKELGLSFPEFLEQDPDCSTGKRIDASGSLKRLGLELKYPSPYDML
ncbi:SDR family oxidoreductase [Paraglaciecola aquimarina]|uniref:SDR family oxidoreductase n=1 Tax=Paraglaciecola algarum TaxID=3050085 RepID=A0ABS9D4F0_9ALTE|nr:SDR family oxidoreductase [Paraglaciecola sp. G1-23]MCF2947310.1 SDR family oxidoreductase [Paraglaciecola sp. G1-23]